MAAARSLRSTSRGVNAARVDTAVFLPMTEGCKGS